MGRRARERVVQPEVGSRCPSSAAPDLDEMTQVRQSGGRAAIRTPGRLPQPGPLVPAEPQAAVAEAANRYGAVTARIRALPRSFSAQTTRRPSMDTPTGSRRGVTSVLTTPVLASRRRMSRLVAKTIVRPAAETECTLLGTAAVVRKRPFRL